MTENYFEIQNVVFDALMQRHSEDENFCFTLRKNYSKDTQQNYFTGTEKSSYFSFSLWYIKNSYPGASIDPLVYQITQRNDFLHVKLQLFQTKSPGDKQNQLVLELLQNIGASFKEHLNPETYEIIDNKSENAIYKIAVRPLERITDTTSLINCLMQLIDDTTYIIDAELNILKEANPEFDAYRISKTDFEKMLQDRTNRIGKFRDELPSFQEIINGVIQLNNQETNPLFKFKEIHNTYVWVGDQSGLIGNKRAHYEIQFNKTKSSPDVVIHFEDALSHSIRKRLGEELSVPFKWYPWRSDEGIRIEESALSKEENIPLMLLEKLKLAETQFGNKLREILKDMQENPTDTKPLNQILYGPPGTGKTHVLTSKYFPAFTSHRTKVNNLDFKTRVRKYTWWQVIAAVFYNRPEGSTVPEIVNSKLIRAKHSPSVKYPDPNHIVWNILQKNPELFEKDDNSVWKVKKQHIDDNYPIIKELHKLLADDALSKMKLKEEEKENFKFVTFHQSFSYEDFIEGIKPVLTKDNEEKQKLNYEMGTGLFYDLCLKGIEMAGYESFLECFEDTQKNRKEKFEAINDDQEKQVAIFIDEINRGNVSAIFGELITLIEDDKRIGAKNEIWVDLPYSKDKFGVPSNLYIIGTMNTADRSVEALDTALRRRFSFEEMLPKPELLSPSAMFSRLMWKYKELDWEDSPYLEQETALKELFGIPDGPEWEGRIDTWNKQMKDKDESVLTHLNALNSKATLNLQELLETINSRIEVLVDRDHTIGHAYFMDVDSMDSLKHAFKNKIIPLLQEYFYGDYRKMEMVIGPKFFVEAKKKQQIQFAVNHSDMDIETGIYEFEDIASKDFDMRAALESLFNKKEKKEEVQ